MIGLVIVTHGGLATEFLSALEHVVGPQTQIHGRSAGGNAPSSSIARSTRRA